MSCMLKNRNAIALCNTLRHTATQKHGTRTKKKREIREGKGMTCIFENCNTVILCNTLPHTATQQ